MKDLRAITKAIVYFEPCLQALLPSHRARGKFYCKQNYTENPYLRSESIGRCFEIMNDMRGIADFKEVINHDRTGGYTRYYVWNFNNLSWGVERQKIEGTVEYRNPPYANTAGACLVWMKLALTFASTTRKAAAWSVKIRQRLSRDLPGLRESFEYGAVEWTYRSDYRRLLPRRRR